MERWGGGRGRWKGREWERGRGKGEVGNGRGGGSGRGRWKGGEWERGRRGEERNERGGGEEWEGRGEKVGSYEGERWKCGKMQRKGEGGYIECEHGKWELDIRM